MADESIADATLPGEPTASVPTSETAPVQTDKSEAPVENTSEVAATMSGALQSPDLHVEKAPESVGESKINGEATLPAPVTETAATEEKHARPTEDTEMKDVTETTATAEPPASVDVDATESSSKKPTNGKRKSTGAVPEHKGKKLNKKKSIPKITHLDAQPGEYYFARLKSYPPWPSVVCDEQMLPTSLLNTRPVTTMQPDGSYRADYADGGKRAHERTFPIMFLHTNEFAWIPNTDLSPLSPEECKDIAEKGKSKSLINAYKVAAEGHDLQYFKDMLLDHQRAIEEDQERREAREAEKAAKASKAEAKKKRKSTEAAADADVDMEDAAGDDEAESKPKSSKKRKKEADSDGEAEKPAKTPKTATKLKLTTPKAPTPAESNKKAKDSSKSTKAKNPKERKSAGKGEEDGEETTPAPKKAEKPLDPAEEKAKKEREVLFLRHKLQKGFLSREQAPKEEEMKQMSDYILKLENYGGDLEVSIIRATKVNKVLKAIIKLNTIPRDEEFNFRKRSHDLLESWNKLLGSEGAEVSTSKGEEPTTNGDHKEEEAEAELAPKVAAPTGAADAAAAAAAAEEAPLPAVPAEAKETVVEGMIDGPAASASVAAEAEKPAEEVKNDAEETKPSTDAPANMEMEGVEAA